MVDALDEPVLCGGVDGPRVARIGDDLSVGEVREGRLPAVSTVGRLEDRSAVRRRVDRAASRIQGERADRLSIFQAHDPSPRCVARNIARALHCIGKTEIFREPSIFEQ